MLTIGLMEHLPAEIRLARVMEMMREMSLQTDPNAMVQAYGARLRDVFPVDRRVSLSRRGLKWPQVRVTRCSLWEKPVNPWAQTEQLPILEGGLLAELIYGNEPRVIDELRLDPSDPSAPYLVDQRSLVALPLLDGGEALNMVVLGRVEPAAFDHDRLPDHVWMANLFGRATQNLVLAEKVKSAYEAVDRELRAVARIQRSLLPRELPRISTLRLAAHYETAARAGGDYYDFFPLPHGQWGIMIADVSGHGTPAAVMMAVTHSIAHAYPGAPAPPSHMLTYLNRQLARHYTADAGAFVTAFYGVYDAEKRTLRYSSAGHNPPRLKRCGTSGVVELNGASDLPLGIHDDESYGEATIALAPGDQILFYTDGITEADNDAGAMFGVERLDDVLSDCHGEPESILQGVLEALRAFTGGRPAADDRTLLAARVG